MEVKQMAKQNWLPIVASVGIGAAAYLSMKKGNSLGKVVQKYMPFGGNTTPTNNANNA
jgi:hypothetical protein